LLIIYDFGEKGNFRLYAKFCVYNLFISRHTETARLCA
jgi:hypothetical protein